MDSKKKGMNHSRACQILELRREHLSKESIKKQYRYKALAHHPDKNLDVDSTAKFVEIKEAYEYLLNYYDDSSDDEEICFNESSNASYEWTLFTFLKNIVQHEHKSGILNTILQKISTSCEDGAIETLRSMDKQLFMKTVDILKKYEPVFHFQGGFMNKLDGLVKERQQNDEIIFLHPTLDDLFENRLYRLTVNDHIYIVPLWHHELVYDQSGNDIYVNCIPTLPSNVTIDSKNNINVSLRYSIQEIWGKDAIDIGICDRPIEFSTAHLRVMAHQTLVLQNGIPRINTEHVYDVEKRGSISLDITLDFENDI
jgi:hypothetical protein